MRKGEDVHGSHITVVDDSPAAGAHVEFGRRLSRQDARRSQGGPKTPTATPKDGCWFLKIQNKMAEPTGLEPATSDVTGRRSNQLNYDSANKLYFNFQI